MPSSSGALCAIEARSGSAYGSATTWLPGLATAARSFSSQAVAAAVPVPGTVLSSLAALPAVPGFCTT